jgi:hypothetical protein
MVVLRQKENRKICGAEILKFWNCQEIIKNENISAQVYAKN